MCAEIKVLTFVAVAKQWNTELYEPLLQAINKEKDIFCDKNRMSGMWSDYAEFCQVVKREQLKTMLFAGVNSDQCVLGTLVDAYNRGYTCVMLEDCCATKTPGGQEVTTRNVAVSIPTFITYLASCYLTRVPIQYSCDSGSLLISAVTNSPHTESLRVCDR